MTRGRRKPWSPRARGFALVGLASVATVVAPELSLERAIAHGIACCEAPAQGAALDPACPARVRGAAWLASRTPWVARRTNLVLEEFDVRWAVERYLDAAVGDLDDARAAQAYAALEPAADRATKGSGRLRFDELGPPIGLPEPGRLAAFVGDRATLDAHAFEFAAHDVEKQAIAAALVEGRPERAIRLAEHYHGRPNTDLRVLVGALDCMSDAPRSREPLVEVEAARAGKRTANFARNYGDVRLVLEACARLLGEAPPPLPTPSDAGALDHFEARMAAALRRWADECDPGHVVSTVPGAMTPCRSNERSVARLRAVADVLSKGEPVRHRLELVAVIAPWYDDAAALALVARPNDGERSLLARAPWSIDEWVASDGADEPHVMPRAFAAAAQRIDELAVGRDDGKELTLLAGVLRLRAARGHALLGDVVEAEAALEGGLVALAPMRGQVQLARSSLAWLLGKRDAALAALDPGAVGTAVDRAAVRLQRATLLLPDVARAREELLAARADAASVPVLADRIRWMLAATGSFDAALAEPADPEALPVVGDLAGAAPEVRAQKTAAALAIWRRWVQPLSSDDARRWRRLALRLRGSAPRDARMAHLLLGARLAPADKAERWLDAFFAVDAAALPITTQAWLRHLVAKARGDEAAAGRWLERFRTLARLAHDPTRAELWRAAGL